jgi:hypothetical protein
MPRRQYVYPQSPPPLPPPGAPPMSEEEGRSQNSGFFYCLYHMPQRPQQAGRAPSLVYQHPTSYDMREYTAICPPRPPPRPPGAPHMGKGGSSETPLISFYVSTTCHSDHNRAAGPPASRTSIPHHMLGANPPPYAPPTPPPAPPGAPQKGRRRRQAPEPKLGYLGLTCSWEDWCFPEIFDRMRVRHAVPRHGTLAAGVG